MNDFDVFLRLSHLRSAPVRALLPLINELSKPSDVFTLSFEYFAKAGISKAQASKIKSVKNESLGDVMKWLEKEDTHYLPYASPNYPPLLKQIASPPMGLFVRGDVGCLQQYQLAIVGSRKPSAVGKETAFNFASELTKAGLIITSGLAMGIDEHAHKGALSQGKSIAVLGHGLDIVYPKQNLSLALEICQNGAVVSEFPLGVGVRKDHFPRRNRIISGLSMGCLIVEAAVKSGSLLTARQALEQNRDVFAIPGSIQSPLSKGCHHLIKEGAYLVEDLDDLLSQLNMMMDHALSLNISHTNHQLLEGETMKKNNDAHSLLESIDFHPTPVEVIASRHGETVHKTSIKLLELELSGDIVCVPGGYQRN